MNVDPDPMILVVYAVLVTISDLFKGVQECDAFVGKVNTCVEKANPAVGKMNASVGKAVVLPLKRNLPFSDEEVCGPSLMAEEMQNTQDPVVTTSGANS